MVSVKINGGGRFPEIGFKAGVNDKEDMNYFFDMIIEMLDRLDG
jgi:DNA-binding protein YbaB